MHRHNEDRDFPYRRAVRIALRTAHIFATGTLVGGYIFHQPAADLLPWLFASVISGILLFAVDLHQSLVVLCELRGVVVLVKIILLLLVPVFWDVRIPLLVTALVIGGVSSHMPRQYRHWVILFPTRVVADSRRG